MEGQETLLTELGEIQEQDESQLEAMIKNPRSPLSLHTLFEAMSAMIIDLNIPALRQKQNISKFFSTYKQDMFHIRRLLLNQKDFEKLTLIGKGTFSEVQLVCQKETKKTYAMKIMNKALVSKQRDQVSVWDERNIMAFSSTPWLTQLHCALQDELCLYLVMEFVPGGNLLTMAMTRRICEVRVRFYAAEMLLALDALHSMGYIHRDAKLENWLVDLSGHLKLCDFGSCLKMDKSGLVFSKTLAGLPDYAPPEMLKTNQAERHFGIELDWWTVGVCIYTMLLRKTPFWDTSTANTFENIVGNKSSLYFPKCPMFSTDVKDLIRSLLTDRKSRLGRKGVEEIMQHPFFKNNQWTFANIRETLPPIKIFINCPLDSSYFEYVEENEGKRERFPVQEKFIANQIPFVGFTYLREDHLLSASSILGDFQTFSKEQVEKLNELQRRQKQVQADQSATTGQLKILRGVENNGLKSHLRKEELEQTLEEECAYRQSLEMSLLQLQNDISALEYMYKTDLEKLYNLQAQMQRRWRGHEFILKVWHIAWKFVSQSLIQRPRILKYKKDLMKCHKLLMDQKKKRGMKQSRGKTENPLFQRLRKKFLPRGNVPPSFDPDEKVTQQNNDE